MEYARSLGYPVPRVEELSANGAEIVMERINGVTMLEAMKSKPLKIASYGAMLADLHVSLHEIAAPEWLDDAPCGEGDRLLHLDLHPMNVMINAKGPVVIDWPNAARGDPDVDVALTWALIAAGDVPRTGLTTVLVQSARRRFTKRFIESFNRDAVVAQLDAIVAWKTRDPHLTRSEVANMTTFAYRARR